ncbi:MAG: hypothetical protein LBE59_12150 [Nevskiaceae bacterium]|nr:hypothetical protein [Nevskiaceae bacterium]
MEFYLVAMLAMFPMLLGMLQVALLLIANHQVDLAAMMAARAGATEGGSTTAIRVAFANALTPMFLHSAQRGNANALASQLIEARARALGEVMIFGQIRLLSPSQEARRTWAIERDGQQVIPNDSLPMRLRVSGGASRSDGDRDRDRDTDTDTDARSTLLEANTLEVEATWCHPLIVPLAGPLLIAATRWLDDEPLHQLCYAADRLPIRSRGIAPMQSDFIVE